MGTAAMALVAAGSPAPKVIVVTKVVDGRTMVCVRMSSWRMLRGDKGAFVGVGGRCILMWLLLLGNMRDGGYWMARRRKQRKMKDKRRAMLLWASW